jgi:hypothetical protein
VSGATDGELAGLSVRYTVNHGGIRFRAARGRSLAAVVLLIVLGGLAACGHQAYPVQAAYTGQGPYATTTGTVTGGTGAAEYDLYYPASYPSLGFKSPIVTWGNGTGGKPSDAAVFLGHLASYGFTIIAATLPNTGSGKEIDAAARYLVAQDSNPSSVFFHHLDVAKVAAAGLSQGAGGAVRAATADPALITTVLTFSLPDPIWARPNPDCPTRQDCMVNLPGLTMPIFLVSTHGPFDAVIASPRTERAYFRSTKVPAALGIIMFSGNQLADHPSIATNPDGMLGYATAWLEYRLRSDTTAAGAFTGAHPELLSNTNWPGSAIK